MGKFAGQFELCAGCSTICVVWLLACVQQKAHWIVVAATLHCDACWKNWGGREEDAFGLGPWCSSSNVHVQSKPVKVVVDQFHSFLEVTSLPNGNAPSLSYRYCKILYAVSFFDVNMDIVWLQIYLTIRLSLLVVIILRKGISCCLQTISRVSTNNAGIRKRNRTGAMLSLCHTPTLWPDSRGSPLFSF